MKKTHIVLLIFVAVAIGVMVSFSSTFAKVDTFAKAEKSEGKTFKITGTLVKDKEIFYDPMTNVDYFTFYLEDKESTVKKVVFRDAKPQDFERAESITLTGKMVNDEFHASQMLTKCPSKYKDNKLETNDYEVKEYNADNG